MKKAADDLLLPVIRAALDQTRSAACITTAELDPPGPRIVYVNPAYCAMTDQRADEVIGLTPRIMQGPLTSRRVLDRLRADLEAGRPFVGEAVNYRSDGRPFLISWRIDPVVGPDGTTTHYIATQEDITRLRRAERLLAAERAIDRSVSMVLSRPADTASNLNALAAGIATAVADLVDYGRVAVVGSIRLGTTTSGFRAGAVDQGCDDLAAAVGDGREASRSGITGDRHWVACPLTSTEGGTEGAIIVADLSGPEADFIDRAGLERAAECAHRALHSVAEYERQRLVAIELQRDLLPEREPSVAGLAVATRYQPGAFATRVGGDWYDVVDNGDQAVLIVGDMAGAGIRAAADMGRVRLLTTVLLQQGNSLPEVFASLNRFCSEEDLVATALGITVEPVARTASVVSAGHLPPIVRRPPGAETVAVTPGPLLGIGGSPHYPEQPLELDGATAVVMFTDGLVEVPGEPIDQSLTRLAAEIAADTGDVAGLVERLVARRLGDDPGDDIAVVAFRPVPADQRP
jgi:PAS domain S-box-containing protein